MEQLARLGLFLLFLALGIRTTFKRTQTAASLFISYVLLLHLSLLLSGRDAWPFSPSRLLAEDASALGDVQETIIFRAVDQAGREWEVGGLAWSPLFPQALRTWFAHAYSVLTPAQSEAIGRFLLRKAEEARVARATRNRWIGNARLLGPLMAPDAIRDPVAASSPKSRFTRLRVSRVYWGATSRRVVLLEYAEK